MKIDSFIISLCTLLLICCKPAKPDASKDFKCKLTTSKKVYSIGELPDIKIVINNKSEQDVYLIGSLDGSEEKWRMPYCYFEIEKPVVDSISPGFRCGTINGLQKEDFKLVRSGESFDPYSRANGYFWYHELKRYEHFRQPGTYKITFFYSTKSNDLKDFAGMTHGFTNASIKSIKREFNDLFLKVPSVDLVSNTIEIEIVE